MADPKHPLLLLPFAEPATKARRSGGADKLIFPPRARQGARLQPDFDRLTKHYEERRVRLQAAVEGVAVEQVVVFEVAGDVLNFYNAVRKSGLHWLLDVDGEPFEPDDDFRRPKDEATATLPTKLFLILSDQQAIAEMLSLWARWQKDGGAALKYGFKAWGHVFKQLRTVRLWDMRDRVEPDTRSYWQERLAVGDAFIRTEIELWYADSEQKNVEWGNDLRALLAATDSKVIDAVEIPAIRYHAFLADLAIGLVQSFLSGEEVALTAAGQVMYYRPQLRAMAPFAGAETAPFAQTRPLPEHPPVVAVMDGVPLQNHALLGERIVLDDPNDLQAVAPARDRVHGTSMASIVLHGDLNGQTPTIPSRVVVHPILVPDPLDPNSPRHEISPPDRLLMDVIHTGVKRLVEGSGGAAAIAPNVRVINLSIGDMKREFMRTMSPLARLLDWLAWRYQLLFVVPTGNIASAGTGLVLNVPRADFENLTAEERAAAAFEAIESGNQYRRLLSPAESLNALTVGGVYADGSKFQAGPGRFEIFPEPWPCPEGRCGPGFLRAIKPDLVAPSGRRLFSEKMGNVHTHATLLPITVSTAPGILSATPSAQPGKLTEAKHSAGTSNAAALVSHAAAHAYGAIEQLRDDAAAHKALHPRFDAVLLKALAVHTCVWPNSPVLGNVLQEADGTERKRRMARLFGYGVLDIDRLRGCTDERATLVSVGEIAAEQGLLYVVPLPPTLSGKKQWRRVTITLAWLSPMNPQHRDYRRALVWFKCDRGALKVSSAGADWQAMRRGTVQHDVWDGEKAAAFTNDAELEILVSCAADAGELDDRVPFALCVSIEVASGVGIPVYEEIRARVKVPVPVPVGAA